VQEEKEQSIEEEQLVLEKSESWCSLQVASFYQRL
jgi:hypothetical protein